MRKILVLASSVALLGTVHCRSTTEAPHVATIPADVTAVDAGPVLSIAAPPVGEREEPIEGGDELEAGKGAIGRHAPGFTLDASLRGGKVRLLKNKVSVVHFWATWCAPCTKSFGVLSKLHDRYAERGLMVVGVSVDDELDGVADFARQHKASFAVTWDAGHQVANLYKLQTMPSTYVIDRSGIVRAVMDGYHDADKVELETTIRSLL